MLVVPSFPDYGLPTARPALCARRPPPRVHTHSHPVPGPSCFASSWKLPHPFLHHPFQWHPWGSVVFCWDLSWTHHFSPCFLVVFLCFNPPAKTVSYSKAVPLRALHRNSVPMSPIMSTQVVKRCLEWRKGWTRACLRCCYKKLICLEWMSTWMSGCERYLTSHGPFQHLE